MALIFLDRTACAICQQTLKEGERISGFPAFTNNIKDPLYLFSDNGVHEQCFEHHSLKDEVDGLLTKFFDAAKSRRCFVDGQIIDKMGDAIQVGFITSDTSEELYNYNFIYINRKNLQSWVGRDHFVMLLRNFEEEGKYVGFGSFNSIDHLLQQIAQPVV
ncbi:hypothetical protein [Chryseolinea soli]|uniref:Uncharacterized protein n=1 Tax=Chryseolinea soli TaxID=2321403 RepID=A0A385SK15_9BACT|nr:hypothetical protein [Chryseolinea soli]AYB31252.1 hypothetical protein D4L85_11965 [Chryseolinea soli]